MIEYILNSLGWSLLGFTVGWLTASLRRDVTAIKERVMPDQQGSAPSTRRNLPPVQEDHHLISSDKATRWLGIIVALLAIVTVTQGVMAQRRIGDVTECQAQFNDEFAKATAVRSQLANDDRLALQNMLLALYQQRGADEARRLKTFEKWVKTVEASERERREHPLPELPKGDCR